MGDRTDMKGKILIGSILAISILICACQQTPEEVVVADKSQGLPEGSIIPEEKDTPKDLGAPEHWKESLVRGDGFVTLEADLDLEIPEVYNTPVSSWEAVPMTDEFLKKLCNYFADGDRIYEYQGMTKSELTAKKEELEQEKNTASYTDYQRIERALEGLEKALEKAPEKNGERKYIEPKLTEPRQTREEQRGAIVYIRDGFYPWYYDTDEKIGFLANVEREEGCDSLIRAVGYDENVGSVSAFLYQQGTWRDQTGVDRDLKVRAPIGSPEYVEALERIRSKIEQTTCEDFTEEDARKMVEDVIEDLDIQDMEIADCVKMIGSSKTESWNDVNLDDPELESGYSFHLYPKAGDVTGYTLQLGYQYEDLPETSYAPAFLTAQLEIMVTEEGVKKFEWDYISEKKDMIAENTKLLPFDEIKEKLADHLLYVELSDENGEIPSDAYYVYDVQSVQLRAANINAFEDTNAAWLVPVWVFEVKRTSFYVYDGGKIHESELAIDTVLLNAIDGGYVTVSL